ncbi:hypothetical protein BCR42DRAFT_219666 [Absidia repens]|uniref:Uncharacterized protein n=1 Tax=Absidia repens TaxID=90262 RepID=A0A1X2INE8_9FUNG|nr:hypothetical protein BCR42DRAFT_219666 [Absidia repens]
MTIFPSINFSTKKRPKRRHSVFSHHAVDKSDVLARPFLPLETRITSPSDLIDLVGHPRLIIEPTSLPPPLNQQQDIFNSYKSNFGSTSPVTPLPSQPALDKTLLDVSPSPSPPPPKALRRAEGPLFSTTRIHFSETLYNTDQGNVRHAPPPILQRRRSSPLPLGSRPQQQQQQQEEQELPMPKLEERDLVYQLRKQYDQEQVAWRQRLHDYRVREEELMDLLESTRAKLDQLQVNADAPPSSNPPSDKRQYHHHHHHHHYYYHYARRNNPIRSSSSSSNSNSGSSKHGHLNEDDTDVWKNYRGSTKSIPTYGPPPPGFWFSPYS